MIPYSSITMEDCDGEESVKQFADYTSWVKFG